MAEPADDRRRAPPQPNPGDAGGFGAPNPAPGAAAAAALQANLGGMLGVADDRGVAPPQPNLGGLGDLAAPAPAPAPAAAAAAPMQPNLPDWNIEGALMGPPLRKKRGWAIFPPLVAVDGEGEALIRTMEAFRPLKARLYDFSSLATYNVRKPSKSFVVHW